MTNMYQIDDQDQKKLEENKYPQNLYSSIAPSSLSHPASGYGRKKGNNIPKSLLARNKNEEELDYGERVL